MCKLLIATFLVLLPTLCLAEVWGSSKSKIYHYRLCRWNAQIKQEYKVSFPNAAAARKAGYEPCKKCRPPMAKISDQLPAPEKE